MNPGRFTVRPKQNTAGGATIPTIPESPPPPPTDGSAPFHPAVRHTTWRWGNREQERGRPAGRKSSRRSTTAFCGSQGCWFKAPPSAVDQGITPTPGGEGGGLVVWKTLGPLSYIYSQHFTVWAVLITLEGDRDRLTHSYTTSYIPEMAEGVVASLSAAVPPKMIPASTLEHAHCLHLTPRFILLHYQNSSKDQFSLH